MVREERVEGARVVGGAWLSDAWCRFFGCWLRSELEGLDGVVHEGDALNGILFT